MAAKRKSWTQKWSEAKAKQDLPKVIDCGESGERFLVPGPAEIEEIVSTIPKGSVIGMDEIARRLSSRHGVETCCPMTTGIFAWLMAYAACETQGLTVDIRSTDPVDPAKAHHGVPWWRVVKTGGILNPKYPGAPDLQKALLEMDGMRVEQKGMQLVVAR